jgi:hypothetical protein
MRRPIRSRNSAPTSAGSKFAGVGADGSRKDWIATRDVYAWLTHISAAGA